MVHVDLIYVLVHDIRQNCVYIPYVEEVLPSDVYLFLIVLLQRKLRSVSQRLDLTQTRNGGG